MKRPWMLLLLVLVVLDIVLVGLAFRHTYADPVSARGSDPAAEKAAEDPPESPVGSEEPTATASPEDDGAAQPLVSELSTLGDLLLVADRGDCTSTEGIQVRAGDAAAEDVVTRSPVGLRAVGSFVVTGPGQARLVGADVDCARLDLTTTDGGRSWERARPGGVWALVPRDGTVRLVSPEGPVEAPCEEPSSLVSFGSEVRVTCTSGEVVGTTDAGVTWDLLTTLPESAVATAWSTPSSLHVLVANSTGDCALVVRSSVDSGASLGEPVCTGLPEGAETPESALAASGSSVVALSGEDVAVSLDAGASFD